jgi:steroid 5-alpha reductase family enzyme
LDFSTHCQDIWLLPTCPAINDSNSCGAATLYFGSLINTSADVQKLTAKQGGANLVKDGIWRFARHINYFGDLLRYLSFSVVAGSIWLIQYQQ